MNKCSFSSSDAVLLHGDCLEELLKVSDCSVDLILCDLPFGTTARNCWDVKIPLKPLWEQFERILKPAGFVALWSQMPFSAELIIGKITSWGYGHYFDNLFDAVRYLERELGLVTAIREDAV